VTSLFDFLIPASISVVLACTASVDGSHGILEGHLKIVSPKEVELADGNAPAATAEVYAEYPLVVLSGDGKKEIARVAVDGEGNYRMDLPPGGYVLDVQDRASRHVRASPKRFTIVSKETARVDMEIDTGVR
jgi:hypothetical protein